MKPMYAFLALALAGCAGPQQEDWFVKGQRMRRAQYCAIHPEDAQICEQKQAPQPQGYLAGCEQWAINPAPQPLTDEQSKCDREIHQVLLLKKRVAALEAKVKELEAELKACCERKAVTNGDKSPAVTGGSNSIVIEK